MKVLQPPRTRLQPRTVPKAKPTGTLTIDRGLIRKAHAKLPPSFDLTWRDCAIMLYTDQYRCVPYDNWPREFRREDSVQKLRKRKYIRRHYYPTVYSITRSGYSLVNWIKSLIEHVSSHSRRAAA